MCKVSYGGNLGAFRNILCDVFGYKIPILLVSKSCVTALWSQRPAKFALVSVDLRRLVYPSLKSRVIYTLAELESSRA